MTVPTIFDTCRPRADVLTGAMTEADFAADLAQVVLGKGNDEYLDPARFFANTYPTRGLKNLLANVCRRLTGAGGEVASIFRLDTTYGGGKSHGLIALCHAARGMRGVSGITEFVDPSLLPRGPVRIAAFDGENADPANGRKMEDGLLAYTPWGEIAYALAGHEGYARVRTSDERRIAPGAETLRELFGGEPTLILLDELSVYLRKVRHLEDARDQLTAFLTSLFKAVEGAPTAALVYTLAIGKDGRATDAYSGENQFIADHMAEAESVSARKATLLNPTEEDETVQVLRRRLFASIDETSIPAVTDAYRALWGTHRESLADDAARPGTLETFRSSYPLHPEVLETLTGKTATLGNFQRVRGMLRLLARTIAHLWEEQPADATAIHLHHIDPGYEPIRQEIVTRLGQSAYVPAITLEVRYDAALRMSPTTTAVRQPARRGRPCGRPLCLRYGPSWSMSPVVRGDLVALGRHRLLCGDAARSASVNRVRPAAMAHRTEEALRLGHSRPRTGGDGSPDTARLCAADRAQVNTAGPARGRGTRGNGAGRRGPTRTRAGPDQASRPGGPDALLGDMQPDRLGGGSLSQRR